MLAISNFIFMLVFISLIEFLPYFLRTLFGFSPFRKSHGNTSLAKKNRHDATFFYRIGKDYLHILYVPNPSRGFFHISQIRGTCLNNLIYSHNQCRRGIHATFNH
jgi:hypothetical protein